MSTKNKMYNKWRSLSKKNSGHASNDSGKIIDLIRDDIDGLKDLCQGIIYFSYHGALRKASYYDTNVTKVNGNDQSRDDYAAFQELMAEFIARFANLNENVDKLKDPKRIDFDIAVKSIVNKYISDPDGFKASFVGADYAKIRQAIISSIEDISEKLKVENEEISNAFNEINSEYDDNRKKLAEALEELSKFETEIKASEDTIDNANKRIKDLEAESKEQEREIEKKKKEIEANKRTLESLNISIKAQEERLAELNQLAKGGDIKPAAGRKLLLE